MGLFDPPTGDELGSSDSMFAPPSDDEMATKIPYKAGVKPPPDNVIEAPHPDLQYKDRFFAENFLPNAAEKRSYYQQRYPGHEFKVFTRPGSTEDVNPAVAPGGLGSGFSPIGGEPPKERTIPASDKVYMRAKNAPDSVPWLATNPEGFPTASEFPKAAGDIAYPASMGVVQGLATAAGGAAGGLPLASAASGSVQGIQEAFRQAIAQKAGVEKDFDLPNILTQQGIGVGLPLLFGTGATLGPEATAEEIAAQRGLPQRFGEWGATKASSAVSGIPRSAIQNAQRYLPEVKALEAQGEGAVQSAVQRTMNDLDTKIQAHKNYLAGSVADTIDRTGTRVDLSDAKHQFRDRIAALQEKANTAGLDAGEQDELSGLKDTYQKAFFRSATPEENNRAQQLETMLGDVQSQLNAVPISDLSKAPIEQVRAFQQLQTQKDALQNELAKFGPLRERPDLVPAADAMRVRAQLQDASGYTKAGAGMDLSRGITNPEKAIRGKAVKALGNMNDSIEEAVKSSSGGADSTKSLWSQYQRMKQIEDALGPLTGDSIKDQWRAGKLLGNLDAPSNRGMRQLLGELDQKLGTSVVKQADLMNAMKYFGNSASTTALSGWGSTSTSKTIVARGLGTAAGATIGAGTAHIAGLGPEAAATAGSIGGALGGATAPLFASPAALRTYMGIGNAMRGAYNGANTLGGHLPFGLLQSVAPQYSGAKARNAWELLPRDDKNP